MLKRRSKRQGSTPTLTFSHSFGRLSWALLASAMAGLAIAFLSVGAAAKTLVIHSTGPSAKAYPPGRMLDEKKVIVLRSGDRLTLLDERGTRVLKGPSSVMLDDKSKPVGITWENLVGSTRLPTAGGVRSLGSQAGSTQAMPRPKTDQDRLWDVDPTVAGDWCVADQKAVWLWRRDISSEWKMTLEGENKIVAVAWPRGQHRVAWPKNLLVKSNSRVTAYMPNQPKRELVLHTIALGQNAMDLGHALADSGCFQQLSVLID